jgi:hypothetical protein
MERKLQKLWVKVQQPQIKLWVSKREIKKKRRINKPILAVERSQNRIGIIKAREDSNRANRYYQKNRQTKIEMQVSIAVL